VKLIVGLGNPGSRYADTRHNVGFRVIDSLRASNRIVLRNHLPTAVYGEGTIEAHAVVLALPLTYMNASGEAVTDLCAHFSIPPTDLIVAHDDLDLHLGRVKLKIKGGDAGHHGVQSIIEHLGTGEFLRIRIGIGRPASRDEIVPYVLSPFTPDELPLLHDAVRDAGEKIANVLRLA
jgi:peptidyl-tRNA hydrolase, PTH1 family